MRFFENILEKSNEYLTPGAHPGDLTESVNPTSTPNFFSYKKRLFICKYMPIVSILCFLLWNTSLRTDFSWDDAEPEILDLAWRMAQGQNIYRDINALPFVFSNHSPLYFMFSALMLKFTGLSFLPPRMISFIAVIFIALAMARLSRMWNKPGWIGIWAAFLLLLIPAFLYNSARCHPHMLAVAFSIWSFAAFIQNRWQYTLILSPLLALLAIYTKQTQIMLPIAMVLYLALRKRKWVAPYISVLVIGGLIPLFWMQKTTDGYFYYNIVTLARLSYDTLAIPGIFIHHAGPLFIFIGIALSFLFKRFKNGHFEEIDCYLLIVLPLTLISLGRPGAHGQYVVELLVVVLIYLIRMPISFKTSAKNTWVSVQILIFFIYTPLFVLLEEGLFKNAANRAYPEIYRIIEAPPGPILSQQGSFPLFTRGEIYTQLFDFAGLSRAGLWDQKYLLDEIEKQTFSYFITQFPVHESSGGADERERFTPEMIDAVRANYVFTEEVYPYYVYRPN